MGSVAIAMSSVDNTMKGNKLMGNKKELFAGLAGYENVKNEVRQIVDMVNNRNVYLAKGARYPRGWVFYGEPGVGKTKFIESIAAATGLQVRNVSESEAIRKDITLKKLIVDEFGGAKESDQVSIIFLDEIDKMVGYNKYSYDVPANLEMQKILMNQMDNIKPNSSIIIATANHLTYFQDAFIRSGRFDRLVQFRLPDKEDRRAIFNLYLEGHQLESDSLLDELVNSTASMSCADLECIVNEAIINSITRRSDSISAEDFHKAIKRVDFKDIPSGKVLTEEEKKITAYHEAGHVLLSLLLRPGFAVSASIIAQGDSEGSTRQDVNEEGVLTKEYCINNIKIALAGMASVDVALGTRATGNSSDLEKADRTIRGLMNDGLFGIEYSSVGSNSSDFYSHPTPDYANRFFQFANTFCCNLYQDAKKQIFEHLDELHSIAKALMEKQELSYQDILDCVGQTAE